MLQAEIIHVKGQLLRKFGDGKTRKILQVSVNLFR